MATKKKTVEKKVEKKAKAKKPVFAPRGSVVIAVRGSKATHQRLRDLQAKLTVVKHRRVSLAEALDFGVTQGALRLDKVLPTKAAEGE